MRIPLGVVVVVAAAGFSLPAQNSTRKVRKAPSSLASRCGSQVQWRSDLATALQESAARTKPVFWYVPTVKGSPMDRKKEIDFYMMAGPFMWPRMIDLLNKHYIPVKEVAGRKQQRQFGLKPRKFIEPGYLVLDSKGKVLRKMGQLTTFHEEWMLRPLAKLVGIKVPTRTKLAGPLQTVRMRAAEGDWQGIIDNIDDVADGGVDRAQLAECTFLHGVAYFRLGQTRKARACWQLVSMAPFKDYPFAWRAAAELEGHGPFVRGFEVFRKLPKKVMQVAGQANVGSRAPHGAYNEAEVTERSLEFLREMRHEDGVYRCSIYDFGGTDSLPNVYAAVTALAIEAETMHSDGQDLTQPKLAATTRHLLEDKHLALADRDELVWALAYSLRTASVTLSPDSEVDRKLVAKRVALLQKVQRGGGAYRHEYENVFATASVLQALRMVKDRGFKVPSDRVTPAVQAVLRSRNKRGAYPYAGSRLSKRTVVPAAAGRMPLCELALLLWGKSDQKKLAAACRAAFEHHQLLAKVRKYDDHAGAHGYGGFFFWYDMLGRTEAICALTDKKLRTELLQKQRKLILTLPEIDGCFVDSHELGRVYGTSVALICLAKIAAGLLD